MSEAKLCWITVIPIFWLWGFSVERTQPNCTVQGGTYFLCAGCMGGGGPYLYRFVIVQFLTALSSIYYCNQSVLYTTAVIVCHNSLCLMYCLSLCGIVQFVSIIFFASLRVVCKASRVLRGLKYNLTLVQGILNQIAVLLGRANRLSIPRLPDNPRYTVAFQTLLMLSIAREGCALCAA